MLVFHALTLHGSSGNRHPTRNRRALALRFTGDGTVFAPTEVSLFLFYSVVSLRVRFEADFAAVWEQTTMPLPYHTGLQPGDRISGSLYPQVCFSAHFALNCTESISAICRFCLRSCRANFLRALLALFSRLSRVCSLRRSKAHASLRATGSLVKRFRGKSEASDLLHFAALRAKPPRYLRAMLLSTLFVCCFVVCRSVCALVRSQVLLRNFPSLHRTFCAVDKLSKSTMCQPRIELVCY